ncbi:MAG: UDP-N-acetylmuramoyl-tripeptide--D-alanyl-D-alanine ligase [Bacteroidales bacterium]|nr:UDP-N-acetylmuramoyl-tripeptide--D-alanyl-D-alanine ligase [Bacteroidales bacterium]
MIDRLYQAYLRSHTVTTDSRAITPGCLFFAFKGERFDGNAFAPKALEQGAALCVISDEKYKADDRCIVVPDVLATLQELAREHRRHLTIPVVGITGTNGKTTTKELVHAVLSKRYRTSATKGNFNNHLGVPLTLLSIPADTEIAIVEMGANHPGEIAFLCGIADPDCGLITNVGRAHLEGFGSFEGVIQTKTELYRHLAVKEGTVFVNADNPILIKNLELRIKNIVRYGKGETAQIRGTLVTDTQPLSHSVTQSPYLHFYFEVGDNVYNVHTHLLGAYNFDNCMAAVAVGLHFGVEPWDIKEAIEEYIPSNQRSEYKETARGNHLYLDCYNANPSSMAAAIQSFKAMGGTMAIIGGMHELGAAEKEEHGKVVEQLAACGLDRVLLVGPEWEALPHPDNMQLFNDTEAVHTYLLEHPVSGATILIKGSNTNRLWTLEELL